MNDAPSRGDRGSSDASRETRLTRRGRVVVGLVLVLVVFGATFGERTLNALVAPAVLGLLVAVATVWRSERPAVERVLPAAGFPGHHGTVELAVEGGRAGTLTIRDRVPDALTAFGPEHEVVGGSATVAHEIRYDRRGEHEVGPAEVTITDLLGLVERTYEYEETDSLLVFPELVQPPEHVLSSLSAVVELQRRPGRDEFDRLREYDRGDAPRDIHWKSSAKRPDDELVVKEFLGETPSDGVKIAVGGSGAAPTIDALAEAAASVCVHLLEEGVEVGLETPEESLEPGVGRHQREAVLSMLARLSSGPPPGQADGEVRIQPRNGRATVAVEGRSVPFRREDAVATGEQEVSP